MKISELLKKYIDEIVEMYDDCDLEELPEEQKEDLMILIHRASLMIVTELSEEWRWNFINFYLYLTLLIVTRKNNILYKSSGELELLYLFKKLGSHKVTKVNFYTKSNSLVIFVKKWFKGMIWKKDQLQKKN